MTLRRNLRRLRSSARGVLEGLLSKLDQRIGFSSNPNTDQSAQPLGPTLADGQGQQPLKPIPTDGQGQQHSEPTPAIDETDEIPTYLKVLQDFSESINSLKDTIHSICRDNTIIKRFDKSLESLSRKGPSNCNVKIGELNVLIEVIKSVINSKKITDADKSRSLEKLNEYLSQRISGIVYSDAVVFDEVLSDITNRIKQFNADVNEIQEDKHSTDGEGDDLEETEKPSDLDILTKFSGEILRLQNVIGKICCGDQSTLNTFNSLLSRLYGNNAILDSNIHVGELYNIINGLNFVIDSESITQDSKALLEKFKQDLSNSIPKLNDSEIVASDSLSIITNVIAQFNDETEIIIRDSFDHGSDDEQEHSKINALKKIVIGVAILTAFTVAIAIYAVAKCHKKNTSNILPSEDESQIQTTDLPETSIEEIIETTDLPETSIEEIIETTSPQFSTETPMNIEDYVLGEENINTILKTLQTLGIDWYSSDDIVTVIQNAANGNSDDFSGLVADQLIPYVNAILQKTTVEFDTVPALQQFYCGEDDILRNRLAFFENLPETYVNAREDEKSRAAAYSFISTVAKLTEDLLNRTDEWFSQASEPERKLYIEVLRHMSELSILSQSEFVPVEEWLSITVNGETIPISDITLDKFDELLEEGNLDKPMTMTPNN